MSKLAIQGGDKAITLDQSEASQWPIIDDEVTEAVVNQLQSRRDFVFRYHLQVRGGICRLSRCRVCLGAQQRNRFDSWGVVRDWSGTRR